jgi:hypothetical protein
LILPVSEADFADPDCLHAVQFQITLRTGFKPDRRANLAGAGGGRCSAGLAQVEQAVVAHVNQRTVIGSHRSADVGFPDDVGTGEKPVAGVDRSLDSRTFEPSVDITDGARALRDSADHLGAILDLHLHREE